MKGTNKPVTVRTAQNHIKQIREFFRWLHKNSDYEWRKPEDFDDLVVSVKSNLREITTEFLSLNLRASPLRGWLPRYPPQVPRRPTRRFACRAERQTRRPSIPCLS